MLNIGFQMLKKICSRKYAQENMLKKICSGKYAKYH